MTTCVVLHAQRMLLLHDNGTPGHHLLVRPLSSVNVDSLCRIGRCFGRFHQRPFSPHCTVRYDPRRFFPHRTRHHPGLSHFRTAEHQDLARSWSSVSPLRLSELPSGCGEFSLVWKVPCRYLTQNVPVAPFPVRSEATGLSTILLRRTLCLGRLRVFWAW